MPEAAEAVAPPPPLLPAPPLLLLPYPAFRFDLGFTILWVWCGATS